MDTYKTHYRLASVTSTTTRTSLKQLVDAVYSAKSKSAPVGRVYKVRLTPSASLEVSDAHLEDFVAITAMTEFEILDALENLYLKNSATVKVEIWYAE